ncbi:MAG: glycosyltransferase family 4 protein [Chloroflexi bacterium]|nr:glycosyltransferase family 4 protein [Chloroflexota bacterium]
MKTLFIVPYPTEAPSNRLRVEQYFPYLERHGVEPILRPFMSSDLYNIRYAPGSMVRKVASLGFSTMSRFFDIRRASQVDLVFVHREAFPVGGPFIEEKLAVAGPPMIFDFDDAIYLLNSGVTSRTVGLLKRPSKTARIVNLSTTVIAGNENLKAYASAYNRNIVVIPTPVDTDHFAPRRDRSADPGKRVVIGWSGSNTTAPYLKMVGEALTEITRRYPEVEIRAIGGSYVPPVSPNLTVRRWSLERELEDLHGFDIGIMPMPDTEWTRGKCGFKALLYMSCGVPPVCSPVGITTDIVEDGANGLLATTTEEWIGKLSMLVEDPALRRRIGDAGRQTVEEKYSLTTHAPRFLETLLWTADTSRGRSFATPVA